MRVTFEDHSGFLLETAERYLIFDYYRGVLPELKKEKPVYVFVSHSHYDHYNTDIFKLFEKYSVKYILSDDIEDEFDGDLEELTGELAETTKARTIFVAPHEKLELDGMTIETLKSTDLGVAFIVKVEAGTIFHAGDFQWWDWPGEPEEDNREMKTAFLEEMKLIEGRSFDLAFAVLDPRQEGSAFLGMEYILTHTCVSTAVPMHFWRKYRITGEFKEYMDKNHPELRGRTEIIELREPGQSFEVCTDKREERP